MITIQKIQIQALCKDHSLPFVYICMTKYCSCQVKLCEKCLTEHETENQNSNIMKIQNFYTKIQTEIDIVNRQSQKFSQQQNSTVSNSVLESEVKLQRFVLNQINVLQDTMKYLNQESSKVNFQIKDVSSVLTTKMDNIKIRRKELPEKFCKKVLDNDLIENLVSFYSQKGFTNFRKKLDKTLQFRGIIKDFLAYADKYGKKYEDFMKSSSATISDEWSMKTTITNLLKSKNYSKFDEIKPENLNSRENNLINQQLPSHPSRSKRAKTIFGKI